MQRVKATACEIGAVAVLVEPLVSLVGWLAPQAATSRARVVVVTMMAAVRPAGSVARRFLHAAGKWLDGIEIRFITASDTPRGITSPEQPPAPRQTSS
jgi:hypothetical protein